MNETAALCVKQDAGAVGLVFEDEAAPVRRENREPLGERQHVLG